jgi:hypothetical protein
MRNNLFEYLVAAGDQALLCGCIDRLTADDRRMTQIQRFPKIIRVNPCYPWSNLGKTGVRISSSADLFVWHSPVAAGDEALLGGRVNRLGTLIF